MKKKTYTKPINPFPNKTLCDSDTVIMICGIFYVI